MYKLFFALCMMCLMVSFPTVQAAGILADKADSACFSCHAKPIGDNTQTNANFERLLGSDEKATINTDKKQESYPSFNAISLLKNSRVFGGDSIGIGII